MGHSICLFGIVLLIVPALTRAAPPPGIDPSDPFVIKGYLPVTLYGAVADDGLDDTIQIQQAIDDAYEYGYVTFFPSGTYLVSEMLRAMQKVIPKENKTCQFATDIRKANVLVGSKTGSRPVLKLAGGGDEFKDADAPWPLVWMWSEPRNVKPAGGDTLPCGGLGSTNPEHEQSNINMNQVFRGIDIEISGDYVGAVGIRHAGSQGSYIEDVSINADGAYAGIYNAPGQGGGTINVTVDGGQYGFYGTKIARYPVLVGVRFLDQVTSSIHWDGQHNLTVVGFEIKTLSTGPVVTLQPGTKSTNGIAFVEGTIEASGFTAIDNLAGRDLHIKDVFVKGTSNIVQNGLGGVVAGSLTDWHKVDEYVYTASTNRSFINGVLKPAGYENSDIDQTPGILPPVDLIGKHLPGDNFPGFEDAETVSIQDYGANGEDDADDTAAIKLALMNHDKVLIPRGEFIISETLNLNANQHLLGAAKNISILKTSAGWNPSSRTPMITTDGDEDGVATLSSILLQARKNQSHLTKVLWRVGRNSVIKDTLIANRDGSISNLKHESFAFEDEAGGKIYGLTGQWSSIRTQTRDSNYRHLRILNTGQPLTFYGLNIERSHANPQSEITGSGNVQIYFLKGEANDDIDVPGATVMKITNSNNISGFGYSGIASPAAGRGLIEFKNTNNVQFSNISHVKPQETPITIKEIFSGATKTVPGRFPLALFKRGDPQLEAVDHTAPPPPPQNTELVSNPGFENNLTNWSRNSKTAAVIVTQASNVKSGAKAVKLEPKNVWQVLTQNVDVVPENNYKISTAMKTTALSGRQFKSTIAVRFYNATNTELSRATIGSVKNTSKSYQVYRKTLAAPPGASYLQIRLSLSNGKQARVYFDDASVVQQD